MMDLICRNVTEKSWKPKRKTKKEMIIESPESLDLQFVDNQARRVYVRKGKLEALASRAQRVKSP